jgi:hypothetical protein
MDPNELSLKYRRQFLKNQLQFNRKYGFLFDKVAEDIAALSMDPNVRFSKSFDFNKPITNRIDAIITEFHDSALELTEEEIRKAWALSNEKNDKIVNQYLKVISGLKASQKAAYYLYNTRALKAFITRKRNTETLSNAVWKISKQLRAEMEIHLGLGISNGDSAQVISRRIRQYLNNPEALFKRVRDNNGRLVASQKMIEFRKANGLTQGTYTSAYKNAMRVARTETNMAYLLADHIRWSQLDMVKGVKISLSAQHPKYNFPEICEVCEGIYPKTFIFVGWHPMCLCHATPVLSSEEDFMTYLRGGKKEVNKVVTQYPRGFQEYVNANYKRLSKYKSVPYWIKDNQDIVESLVEL